MRAYVRGREAGEHVPVRSARREGGSAETEVIYCSDFSAGRVAEFDAFAFGCPAMGDEVLEETEFQPMWDDVKGALSGRKVGLFGSYGWGDGKWLRDWVEDAKNAGAQVVGEGLMVNSAPDGSEDECREYGKALA